MLLKPPEEAENHKDPKVPSVVWETKDLEVLETRKTFVVSRIIYMGLVYLPT